MKRIIPFLLLSCTLVFSSMSLAVDGFSVFYLDGEHFRQVNVATDHQGKTVYTDENGRQLGVSIEKADGSFSFRDKLGLIVGSAVKISHDKTLYKDKAGKEIGNSIIKSDGSIDYRNNKGNVVAVASVN